MKFWDSSGIVPLVVDEENTDYCLRVLRDDPQILVWCLCRLEVMSALCRRLRDGSMPQDELQKAKKRLMDILNGANEVTSMEKVRARALRLLEVHPLRAADACQLASALVASKEDPERLPMICLDHRLKLAAGKEGFVVNPKSDPEPHTASERPPA